MSIPDFRNRESDENRNRVDGFLLLYIQFLFRLVFSRKDNQYGLNTFGGLLMTILFYGSVATSSILIQMRIVLAVL